MSSLEQRYQSALSKLLWGKDGEWSVSITPGEADALWFVLYEHGLAEKPGTVDKKIHSGDPGDEQVEQ